MKLDEQAHAYMYMVLLYIMEFWGYYQNSSFWPLENKEVITGKSAKTLLQADARRRRQDSNPHATRTKAQNPADDAVCQDKRVLYVVRFHHLLAKGRPIIAYPKLSIITMAYSK